MARLSNGVSVLTDAGSWPSTFLILFDVTAVVVAMPAIAKDVGLGMLPAWPGSSTP